MASVNVDKLSLKELLDLDGKIEKAIAVAREREHGELKQDLAAFAEKRGFSLKELFGPWQRQGQRREVRQPR